MSKLPKLRIQIAPLGFESDRIVLPAVEMKADIVWILIHNKPEDDKAKPYLVEIKKALKQKKIPVKTKATERLSLFSTIRAVKEIIQENDKHAYYVNVSSGSKIQAIACTMACLMFNEKDNLFPYYVVPEGYEGERVSWGMKDIIDLPRFEIQIPEKKLVRALEIIQSKGGKITKKELADSLADKKEKLIEISDNAKNPSQSTFASLDKNFIHHLKNKWQFIKEEQIGRNRWIEIKPEGKNVIEFLGGKTNESSN